MTKQPISIYMDKKLLSKADIYLDSIGLGANRSALLQEALTQYLINKGAY